MSEEFRTSSKDVDAPCHCHGNTTSKSNTAFRFQLAGGRLTPAADGPADRSSKGQLMMFLILAV